MSVSPFSPHPYQSVNAFIFLEVLIERRHGRQENDGVNCIQILARLDGTLYELDLTVVEELSPCGYFSIRILARNETPSGSHLFGSCCHQHHKSSNAEQREQLATMRKWHR